MSIRDRNFLAYIGGRIVATAGFCIMPFITLFYTSEAGGKLDKATVMGCFAAMQVVMSIGYPFLGWLGDHKGHRAGVMTGVAMQSVALIVMIFSAGKASCLLTYSIVGVVFAAGFISNMNMLFETCPHDSRAAHMTLAYFIMGVPVIVFPMIAGAVAQHFGFRALFTGCFVISIAAFLWFVFLVKDPRKLKARQGAPQPP